MKRSGHLANYILMKAHHHLPVTLQATFSTVMYTITTTKNMC